MQVFQKTIEKMEKIVMIQQQLPLQERSYTDRNGQQQMFASRGFVLSDGIDTFYGEMTGEYARSQAAVQYDTKTFHTVQAQIATREYRDKDGNTRYQSEIRITKLV